MKYLGTKVWIAVAALILGTPLSVLAADAQPSTGAPVYKPPIRGNPGGRVGGGTRGIQREVFVLSVLAPDHSGFTTSEQPSLYWYISTSTSLPVELTVMDPQGVQPILETRIPAPVQAGVHRVRLADHNIRLSPWRAVPVVCGGGPGCRSSVQRHTRRRRNRARRCAGGADGKTGQSPKVGGSFPLRGSRPVVRRRKSYLGFDRGRAAGSNTAKAARRAAGTGGLGGDQ